MRNLQQVQVRTSSGFEKICPFPVGYIYMSTQSTSPASIYGGTWVSLTDGAFLRASGSWNSRGGASTNTHSHWMPLGKEGDLSGLSATYIDGWADGSKYGLRTSGAVSHSIFTRDLYVQGGSGQGNATESTTYSTTISTLPPYRTCYCWYRTA